MDVPIDDSTAAYLTKEKIFPSMYEYLNQCIKKTGSWDKDAIVKRLEHKRCIWQDGNLLSATQVVGHWNEKTLFPYLCELSTTNKEHEELFSSLGVQKEASFELIFEKLQLVGNDHREIPLEDEALEFVVGLIHQLARLQVRNGRENAPENMLLPDERQILHQASSMSCDSNLQGEAFLELDFPVLDEFRAGGGHFVHEQISRSDAIVLGAKPLLEAFLQNIEDNEFLDGTDFGQEEHLVDRLNSILKKYPADSTIFKEFIQNADDAQATDVVFILDHRTDFPDVNMLSDSESHNWKQLQHTPSLLVLNNRCFAEKDIKGICCLGRSAKRDSPNTIGRFRIGFNIAYHLTDCPSFITFKEVNMPTDFCVFDPLCKYCPKATIRKPGRRWRIKQEHIQKFSDQFSPFLMDLMEDIKSLAPTCLQDLSKGYVVFRMPLTRWLPDSTQYSTNCHSSSTGETKYLQEGRANDVHVIKRLLFEEFRTDLEKMLLFPNNVRHLSVFEIPQRHKDLDLPLLHHFTCTSTFTSVVDQTNHSIATVKYETKSIGNISAASSTYSESKWLICKRHGLKNKSALQSEASHRGLKPFGGTATPITMEGNPIQGSLFCYLPMPISSELPVHINGHFLVDDSRKHLDSFRGLEEWNTIVAKDIVTLSYVDLLIHARDFANGITMINEWFYNLFPDLTSIMNIKSKVSQLQIKQTLYKQLLESNSAVLFDARCTDGHINWLTPTGKNIGYFCIEHADVKPQPELRSVLVSLGMPITTAPKYVFKSLCEVSKKYTTSGLVTPEKVIQHIKSLMPLSHKHTILVKDNCTLLLFFCLQNSNLTQIKQAVRGTPILLSVDNTLVSTGKLFATTFLALLPHCGKHFIHPSLEKDEVGNKLEYAKVIEELPLSFVASHLQLICVDTSYTPTENERHIIRILWSYLDQLPACEKEKMKDELYELPILPTTKETFSPTATKETFFPLSHSKCVFIKGEERVSVFQVMMKLGYSQIDFSVVGKDETPTTVKSMISSPHCASDIIQCLKMQKVGSYNVHFDEVEVTQFILTLSQADSIPVEVACTLKQLPFFKLFDSSYSALSSDDDFCILPEGVPEKGLSKLHKATNMLVLKSPESAEEHFYKKVIDRKKYESAKFSSVQFYSDYIIPNIAHLGDADLLEHLKYVHCHAELDAQAWKCVLNKLKVTSLVRKDGKGYEASKFYNPKVKFFAVFYKQKLPPVEWHVDDQPWRLALLESIGLQTEITKEQWLDQAKKLAENVKQMSKNDAALDMIEKSELLMESLITLLDNTQKNLSKEESANDESSKKFLQEVSEIPFIHSAGTNEIEDLLQQLISRNPTNCSQFVRFQNSVFPEHAKLAGLQQSILPKVLDYHKDIITALGISKPPPVKVVVENLISLTEVLNSPQVNILCYHSKKTQAIKKLKKIIEAHYTFLDEYADGQSVAELLTKRCIQVSPDYNSIILAIPSEVVLQLPPEADFRPFFYQALPELLKHDHLRESLHIQQNMQPHQYLDILRNIKEEMEETKAKLSDDLQYSKVCRSAYCVLIVSLRNCQIPPELPEKMYLPTTDLELVETSQLVHNDTPWIASRLERADKLKYKFLLSPPPDKQDQRTLPACLQIKHLSDLAVEKLHGDVHIQVNRCIEEDMYEKKTQTSRCVHVQKLVTTFTAKELYHGFNRLYWHEQRKHPSTDKPFMKRLLALKELTIHCVNMIKTTIELEGKSLHGTEDETKLCHLDTKHQKHLKLHIAHPGGKYFHEEIFLEQLSAILNCYLNHAVKNEMYIKEMLKCRIPADIEKALEQLCVIPYDPKSYEVADCDIKIGEELFGYEDFLQKEDQLIFCNFSVGDKIVYHCARTGRFLCAKVTKNRFDGDSTMIFDNCLCVQVGAENEIVTTNLLHVYKILTPSQRAALNGSATRFANALILANFPYTEQKQWLAKVLHSCVIQSCTGCSKLIFQTLLRLVAHLHYSLVTLNLNKEMFIPIMEKLCNIISEDDLPWSSSDNFKYEIVKGIKKFMYKFENSSIEDSDFRLVRKSNDPPEKALADSIDLSLQDSTLRSSSTKHFHPLHSQFHASQRSPSSVFAAPQPSAPQRRSLPLSAQMPVSPYPVPTPSQAPPDLNHANATLWLQQAKADYLAARYLYNTPSGDVGVQKSVPREDRDVEKDGGDDEDFDPVKTDKTEEKLLAKGRKGGNKAESSLEEIVKPSVGEGEKSPLGEAESASEEEKMVKSTFKKLPKECQYPALICSLAHDSVEKCIKGIMYAKCGLPTCLLDCRKIMALAKHLDNSSHCPEQIKVVVKECVMQVVEHAERSRYPNYNIPPCVPASCYSSLDANQALSAVKQLMKKVISEPDLKELVGELDKLPGMQPLRLTGPGEAFPKSWDRQDGEFQLIALDPFSSEYHSIAAIFLQTLPEQTVTRIERIQNKLLWRKYIDSAKRMAESNNGMINEKILFHGTSKTHPEVIYQGSCSFDLTFSNDGLWGKGNYFAVNALYSHQYAYHKGGYLFMLVAKVLTGFAYDTGPNHCKFNQPPPRPSDGMGEGQIQHNYDCVSGETGGSRVYITYDNEKAYPAYLITFQ